MITFSIDPLVALYTSGTWASEIAGRFNSIVIKGYSVSRQILGIANDD